MYFNLVYIGLLGLCYMLVHNIGSAYADPSETNVLQGIEVGVANLFAAKEETEGCVEVDGLCLPECDLSSYEAIKGLHKLLDDDKSGEIDMTESVDFLKEELTITGDYKVRQKNLHHNSDSFISVQDLWHMWTRSEVHNWTVEQTVTWLTDVVGLPQYGESFVSHSINGSYLPRLTLNKGNYLGSVLGIKGLSHRTKVTVKAMDAVLFGTPKGSVLKDLLIAGLVTVIFMGLGYIILRNHKTRGYHTKLITQIEELQQDEIKYKNHLHKIKEKERNNSTAGQKGSTAVSSSDVPDSGVGCDVGSVSDVSSNNDDDGNTSTRRMCTEDYNNDYDSNSGSVTPPNDYSTNLDRSSLEYWLQVTYQKEKAVLDSKRKQAQTQIVKASEICNKLRAQGKNPLNLFSLMHGKMDNVEKTISLARGGMQEVQRDEKERLERWGEIERLLDCNIRQLADLHNVMGSYTSLQTSSTNPADSSNIETTNNNNSSSNNVRSATAFPPGGSVRSTGSSTRSTNSTFHHSATIATELQRGMDDKSESGSLPRCSSVGSGTANIRSSASQQQLSEGGDNASIYSNSSRLPPQKRPRRNRPSSVIKANGLTLAEQQLNASNSVLVASTPCTDASTLNKSAGFTMGGSPLMLPSNSTIKQQLQQANYPVTDNSSGHDTVTNAAQQSRGVCSSASDPLLNNTAGPSQPPSCGSVSNNALTPSSTPHLPCSTSTTNETLSNTDHRTLSQLPAAQNTPGLTPSSTRPKKKSFLGRLTSGRKSIIKASKT